MQFLRSYCFLACMLGLSVSPALGQGAREAAAFEKELLVYSEEEIVDAYGLVLREPELRGVGPIGNEEIPLLVPRLETRKALLRKVSDEYWALMLKLRPGDSSEKVRVLGVAKSISGVEVHSMLQQVARSKTDKVRIACDRDEAPRSRDKLALLQLSTIEKVLDIKQQRVEVLSDALEKLLSTSVLEELNRREVELGLSYPTSITHNMPPAELARRVAAIDAILAASSVAK